MISTNGAFPSTGTFWVASASLSSAASTIHLSTGGGAQWEVGCQTIHLSTGGGATCDCGKFVVSAESLMLKERTLVDVRQIVASGYKLTHGGSAVSIQWT